MFRILFIFLFLVSFVQAKDKLNDKLPQFSKNLIKKYNLKANTYNEIFIGNHIIDKNNNKINYDVSGIPFGMRYDSTKQTIVGVPDEGLYSMIIFASNNTGAMAAYVVDVIVGNAKDTRKGFQNSSSDNINNYNNLPYSKEDLNHINSYPAPTQSNIENIQKNQKNKSQESNSNNTNDKYNKEYSNTTKSTSENVSTNINTTQESKPSPEPQSSDLELPPSPPALNIR